MSTVKFIHSAMTGAPVLTGQAGSLTALLDAVLVNGFGAATVDSLVVAGGVATVTRAAGHPFAVSEITQIAGATVTGGSVNGDKIVLSATATQYTFAAVGIPNQTATGTITHKVAPLGWENAYATAGNIAAYRSPDVTGTRLYLRVDDTGARTARVVGYETMSGLSTGTGPFPTAAQLSGGAWWPKSQAADAAANAWVVVGDARGFFFASRHSTTNPSYSIMHFGDFASRKSPDAYGCSLAGMASDLSTFIPGSVPASEFAGVNNSVAAHWAPRGVSGLGSAVAVARMAASPYMGSISTLSGQAGSFMAYPNPADNGLYVAPMSLTETVPTICYRGDLPGAWFVPQSVGVSVFATRDIVTGVTGLAGRTLRAINNNSGPMFFDVTGPWAR